MPELAVPSGNTIAVGLPDTDVVSAITQIQQANGKEEQSSKVAWLAATSAYATAEAERIKRQKPVLITLVITMLVQLIITDLFIGYSVWRIFQVEDTSFISSVLDILKFHITSTIVELIAIFYFIVKGTFNDSNSSIMKDLIKSSSNS